MRSFPTQTSAPSNALTAMNITTMAPRSSFLVRDASASSFADPAKCLLKPEHLDSTNRPFFSQDILFYFSSGMARPLLYIKVRFSFRDV